MNRNAGKRLRSWSVAAVLLAAGSQSPGFGQGYPSAIWQGGSGQWTNSESWSCFFSANTEPSNCVPGTGFYVSLGFTSATIFLNGDYSLKGLTGGPAQTLSIIGGLITVPSATLGSLSISSEGSLTATNGLALNGAFNISNGTVDAGGGSMTATGGSTITAQSAIYNSTLNVNGGSLTVSNSSVGGNSIYLNVNRGSATVNGGAIFNNVEGFSANDGGTVTVDGGMTVVNLQQSSASPSAVSVNATGNLGSGAAATMTFQNGGKIFIDPTNQSSQLLVGTQDPTGHPLAPGQLNFAGAAPAGVFAFAGLSAGGIDVNSTNFTALDTNVSGGTFTVENGGVLGSNTLEVVASANTTAELDISSTRGVIVQQDIVLGGPASTTGPSKITVANNALLQCGGHLYLGQQGQLKGQPSNIKCPVIEVMRNGKAAPGDPGPMNITGNLTVDPGGIIELQIASPTNYDTINITGNGTFNGIVNLVFINGYAPAPGDTFHFISATGTVQWTPSQVNFIGVKAGQYTTSSAGGFSLTATSAWTSTPVPAVVYANPPSGSGQPQIFTFTWSDTGGYQNLSVADVLINSALDGRTACYIAFVPTGANSGSVYLVDNAGDAGGPYQGLVLPGSGSISNGQCTVNGTGSSVSGSGTSVALTLSVNFSAGFAGNRVLYLSAQDKTGGNSGWQIQGTWNVPGQAPSGPSVTGMSPAHTVGLGPTTYTFTFSDTNGWQDITVANVLIASAIDGRHACYLAIVPATQSVFLVDDAGDAGGPYTGFTPGSGTASNSQCTASGSGASLSGSGNTLTVTLPITFHPALAGNQVFFLAARSNAANSNWQAAGSVTVE